MAASSATSIIRPDVVLSAPSSGALYAQQQTLDISVDNPSSSQFNWSQSDLAGGGPVHLRQNGFDIAYNVASKVPIFCLQLPTINVGTSLLLAAGTQIPAPDSNVTGGSGSSSYVRVQAAADIDWVGGIGTPNPSGGGQPPDGTLLVMLNVSPSGAQINVIHGPVLVGAPSVTVGFMESATFVWEHSFGTWIMIGKSGGYNFNGNNGPDDGSRVIQTVNNTPLKLFGFNIGVAQTPGIGCRFDIGAQVSGSAGATEGWWIGGYAAWDGNNVLRMSSKGTTGGTNGGALPAGWDIAFFSNTGGFNGVNAIGDNINTIRWRGKFQMIAAPF
jgi:hypothetical protein